MKKYIFSVLMAARGQRRAFRDAEEAGRHAPARDDLRRIHRPLALRVHGGYLRSAAA